MTFRSIHLVKSRLRPDCCGDRSVHFEDAGGVKIALFSVLTHQTFFVSPLWDVGQSKRSASRRTCVFRFPRFGFGGSAEGAADPGGAEESRTHLFRRKRRSQVLLMVVKRSHCEVTYVAQFARTFNMNGHVRSLLQIHSDWCFLEIDLHQCVPLTCGMYS